MRLYRTRVWAENLPVQFSDWAFVLRTGSSRLSWSGQVYQDYFRRAVPLMTGLSAADLRVVTMPHRLRASVWPHATPLLREALR